MNVQQQLDAAGPLIKNFARLRANLAQEGDTNGVWNGLLNIIFPFTSGQGYVSCPEGVPYDGSPDRCDLIIRRMNNYGVSLLFEGKGTNGPSMKEVKDQLERYASVSCYAIGAKATRVCFWLIDYKQYPAERFRPISVSRGQVSIGRGGLAGPDFDITVANDWENVKTILHYINTTPVP
ncbi:hypothetical protein C8Q75DRAFT_802996 [Abortiporus biennis]|nr:hypothetical protein C8Q75DRAFT_802996 [Abortiporus biennis]